MFFATEKTAISYCIACQSKFTSKLTVAIYKEAMIFFFQINGYASNNIIIFVSRYVVINIVFFASCELRNLTYTMFGIQIDLT